MVGNYLAVIALCGMVAEMVAILHWELSEPKLNGQPMSAFEKLGQERRVRVLSAYGILSDGQSRLRDDSIH
jgi:hypothetical protein